MIPAPKFPLLWYNPVCPSPDRFTAEGVAAGTVPQRKARAAYGPTPKPGPICGILKSVLRGFASHGRTDRPSAWQGRRFALPLHPSRSALTPEPSGAPSCSLRPMTEALPLDTIQGRSCPWKPRPRRIALGTRRGLSRPSTTRRNFRIPAPTTRAFALWTSSRRLSGPCTLTRDIRSLDPEQDTPFLHLGRVSPRTQPWGGHGAGDRTGERNRSQRGREAWRMI